MDMSLDKGKKEVSWLIRYMHDVDGRGYYRTTAWICRLTGEKKKCHG